MNYLSLIPTPDLQQELNRRRSSSTSARNDKLPLLVATTLEAVEHTFNTPAADVLGTCREGHLVKARFAAWMLLNEHGMTRREIARAFLRQDVGTIRHGCLRGRDMVRQDKCYARDLWNALHFLKWSLETQGRQPHSRLTGPPAPVLPPRFS